MILVVGATGQLGTAIIRKLVVAGHRVRGFVRPTGSHKHLQGPALELSFGDLRDAASVDAAVKGADAVIATANAVVPERRTDTFEAVEGEGYQHLFNACTRHGVKQVLFMSVPVSHVDDEVPTFRFKRFNERRLQESGLPYTIIRGSLFMDDWLALIGSSIPLRGAEAATLKRRFWFSSAFLSGVGKMIENRGLALIPGDGKTKHAFVALEDVAEFFVKTINHPKAMNAILHVGGPEILSWNEVVGIFSKVLGKPVRALHTPAGVFRFQQIALNAFSPAAANIMGLNWLGAISGSEYDMGELCATYGVRLTSVEDFLRNKLALPPV